MVCESRHCKKRLTCIQRSHTCRARRVKCDEAKPSCNNCGKKHRRCVYDNDVPNRSKTRYARRGARSPSDAVLPPALQVEDGPSHLHAQSAVSNTRSPCAITYNIPNLKFIAVMAKTNRGQKSHQVGRVPIAGCIGRPNRRKFQLAFRRSFGREKGQTRMCRPSSGTRAPCPP